MKRESNTVIIRPSRRRIAVNLREVWEYRELLYFLIWRDIKVRYKQTVLGAAWAVIQPFFTMVIFSVFFGYLAGLPSDGLPYPVFTYCALLPWTYFAHALTHASMSLVEHRGVITKVYFPRLIVPCASVLAGLMDFGIAFSVFVGMLLFYRVVPTAAALTLPLFLLLAVVTALSVGLWFSVLNVQYRDVRYTLSFLTQLWFFLTPVAYSSRLVPERWRAVYGINPMAGVVEGFRWALLGKTEGPGVMLWVSVVVVILLLIGGLFYFRWMEKTVADFV